METLEDRGIPGSMIPTLLLTESSPNLAVDQNPYARKVRRNTIEVCKQVLIDWRSVWHLSRSGTKQVYQESFFIHVYLPDRTRPGEMWLLYCILQLMLQAYISFNANPPPTSSVSLLAKIPLKSAASPAILGASPLFGALGLASLLLFSWPAFDGNVGNMAVLLGFGSSLK